MHVLYCMLLIFVMTVCLLQDCELLLLSRLGWDVYLDCNQEEPTATLRLDNLNFTETSR